MRYPAMIWISLMTICFTGSILGQDSVRLEIAKIETLNSTPSYVGKADRKVLYRLINDSHRPVIVYGNQFEDDFRPIGYFLRYDEEKRAFMYPTRNNKPIEWKKRGSLGKDSLILCPGNSLEYESLYYSEDEGRFRLKATAFVSYGVNENPFEVVSPEFSLLEWTGSRLML